MQRKKLGAESELLAAKFLEGKKYRILEKNVRCSLGEVDIVALDKGVVVFVEVRSSMAGSFGHPKESVTPKKRQTLSMVALWYLKRKGWLERSARFDVVTVVLQPSGIPKVEHCENAFDRAY
ncbi:MAG: YraN family protein [Deltaproteobacteria bacterium]|nr:YraN family protein [Deltaproteobacteria bacterium]